MSIETDMAYNESGYMIFAVVLLLALLSFAAITTTKRGVSDLVVAANRQNKVTAFHAADSGIHYVAPREAELYGDGNDEIGVGVRFPNATIGTLVLNPDIQEYSGTVVYQGDTDAPRGAGFETGKFDAHWFDSSTTGFGPRNAEAFVRVRFYRIAPSGE